MPDGTLVPGLFWCDPSGLAGEILPGDSSSYAAPGFHWRVTYPYSRGWENSGHADTQDNAIAAADDWIRYVTSGEMEADAYAD